MWTECNTQRGAQNTDRRAAVVGQSVALSRPTSESAVLLAVRWGVTGWFLTEN